MKSDTDFIIKKSDVIFLKTIKYIDKKGNLLLVDEDFIESTFDIYRYAFLVEGHIIDILTGQEIYPLPQANEKINGTIYANTLYYISILNCEVEDALLIEAAKAYNNYLYQQSLINEKKLIPFRNRRLC